MLNNSIKEQINKKTNTSKSNILSSDRSDNQINLLNQTHKVTPVKIIDNAETLPNQSKIKNNNTNSLKDKEPSTVPLNSNLMFDEELQEEMRLDNIKNKKIQNILNLLTSPANSFKKNKKIKFKFPHVSNSIQNLKGSNKFLKTNYLNNLKSRPNNTQNNNINNNNNNKQSLSLSQKKNNSYQNNGEILIQDDKKNEKDNQKDELRIISKYTDSFKGINEDKLNKYKSQLNKKTIRIKLNGFNFTKKFEENLTLPKTIQTEKNSIRNKSNKIKVKNFNNFKNDNTINYKDIKNKNRNTNYNNIKYLSTINNIKNNKNVNMNKSNNINQFRQNSFPNFTKYSVSDNQTLSTFKNTKTSAQSNFNNTITKTTKGIKLKNRKSIKNLDESEVSSDPSVVENEQEVKEFMKLVKHKYMSQIRERFNRMYGFNKEFNKERKKLKLLRKNDSIDLIKYQECVIGLNNLNVSGDFLYNLYKDLKHLRCQSEIVKPLPPVNFRMIVEDALNSNEAQEPIKKSYVKQWKTKAMKLSDMGPYEREMYEIDKEARSLTRKGIREPKIFQLLPDYLVEALYRKKRPH